MQHWCYQIRLLRLCIFLSNYKFQWPHHPSSLYLYQLISYVLVLGKLSTPCPEGSPAQIDETMATSTRNLPLRLQVAWSIFLRIIDVARYTFTYPWRDSYFSISQILEDPDRYLDQWIQVQQSEYSFIGLVVSVTSATQHPF